ncbi:hypothetical protein FDP41_008443 [Naegleria fowleri]|uniref:Uncharacterized protein n=1 Tax=Naegleria fowleri TaxID=5763 RepID=A0A6A5BF49_NAEFO|nr:uncharacterized protein FDP41_008443 [Naegleria fowleri]KAF0973236.1 hypothetical protein FDP41_008443 [Naegleria fowleri]
MSSAALPPSSSHHVRSNSTTSSSAHSTTTTTTSDHSNQAEPQLSHHSEDPNNTQLVSRSDVAFIVLQYLREENFKESYEAFKKESREILADFDTNSQLKGLSKILTEYVQLSNLQQQNSYRQALVHSICRDVKKQQTVSNLLEAMTSLLESVSSEQFIYSSNPGHHSNQESSTRYCYPPSQQQQPIGSNSHNSTNAHSMAQFDRVQTNVTASSSSSNSSSTMTTGNISCTTPSISPSATSCTGTIPNHSVIGSALSPHSSHSRDSSSTTNHSIVSAASVASQVPVTNQSKQKKSSTQTKTKKQSKTSKVEKKATTSTQPPPTFPPLYPPLNACFPFPMYPPNAIPFHPIPVTLPDPIETPLSTNSSTPASTNYSSDQKENHGNMQITPPSSSPKTPRHKGQSSTSPTTIQKIFGSVPNSTSTAEPNFAADDFFNSPSFFFQSPLLAKTLTSGKRKRERFEIEENTGLCVTLFEDNNTKADKDHSDVDAFLATLKYD